MYPAASVTLAAGVRRLLLAFLSSISFPAVVSATVAAVAARLAPGSPAAAFWAPPDSSDAYRAERGVENRGLRVL